MSLSRLLKGLRRGPGQKKEKNEKSSNDTKPTTTTTTTTTTATTKIDSLQKLQKNASALETQKTEADRLATIQTARDLIHELQTPQESMVDITYSPTHALCVCVGIDLDVFNTIVKKDGSASLDEIAAVKGADPMLVERVLRILVAIRYVDEDGVKQYRANDMTRQMTDRLAVARVKFIWMGMPTLSKIPEFLVKTDFKNPKGAVGGPFNYAENFPKTIWEWVGMDQAKLDTTNTFMEADRGSRPSWLEWFPVKERIVDGFDASVSEKLLVDVAGGRGHDLDAFRKKFPDVAGQSGRLVVEDLPQVINDIHDLDASIERLGFDLFAEQPVKNARAYYLKFILHDWSDEDCRKILDQLAAAMKKGYSKLVIEEFILADTNCAMLSAMWDWEMMVFCNSMERTKGHWQQLLESAGFKNIQFSFPPGDGQGIIEAEVGE